MARQPRQKPRKIPRQARSQETVEAILEATARILEEKGVEAANTNKIAARAGVSVGSLYQYFPGKEAIFAELVRAGEAAVAENVARLIAATHGQSLARRLDALIAAAIAQQFDRPRLARMLDYLERTLARDARLATIEKDLIGSLAALLAEHRDSHRRRDFAVAAADLLAIVEAIVGAASDRGETDLSAIARRVRWATMGYLEAR